MLKLAALSTAALLMPAAALAQAAPTPAPTGQATAAATAAPTVGAKIYDAQGGEVGTISAVTAQAVTIDTGTNKVSVPPASIGSGPKGAVFGMTKAELDAAYAKQAAAVQDTLQAKLVAGTAVKDRTGTADIGTIKDVAADGVTLTTAKGDVKLPTAGFSVGPAGNIIIGMTAAEFNAAVGSTAGAAPTTAANPKS